MYISLVEYKSNNTNFTHLQEVVSVSQNVEPTHQGTEHPTPVPMLSCTAFSATLCCGGWRLIKPPMRANQRLVNRMKG